MLLSGDNGAHCPSDTNPRLLTLPFVEIVSAPPAAFRLLVAFSSLHFALVTLSLSLFSPLFLSFSLSPLFFVSRSLGSVQRRATLLEFYWIAATAFIKLDVAN